jgi:hypothetical protein
MSGWIAISRDIFNHDFFAREPMSEREAWVWMIARAAWEPTRHKVGNDMLDVPRGSFFCTLRELQQAWGWGSDFRVRTFLKRTQAERMIDTKTNAGKTHVTICNYDEYQATERTENAPKTQAQRQNKRTKETINNKQVEEEEENARAALCSVLRAETADAFIAHRKAKRAKLTSKAASLLADKLRSCADPDAEVERSIMQGWTGIFPATPLKAINGGRHDRTQFDSAHREYTRRIAAGQIDRGPDPSDPFAGR